MHHRAAGKFKQSIIAKSLGLKWFTTVIHHLGNVLLQKNSFLLPVCWWTNSILLCRRGELLDFLICRNSPIKLCKRFRWVFYLPSSPKNRFWLSLTLFSLLFSTPLFPCLLLQTFHHQMAIELVGARSGCLKEEIHGMGESIPVQ